ncbi:SxtJ family membrane protein [Ferrovibrio sp.]|uniref:SxtJ family membrane protein n=1 Tax=Ferrovibrio sp. TaxID=1917215 RepID=UPI000CBDB199|nr:SxtJ family membrane protein [Ferrovibrio sp.]PJI41038.1 MAG: hypothetical protein CTR53_09040 [Ferrovibrio sp.]
MAGRNIGIHEQFDREDVVEGPSDRSFGLVFAGFFMILAALGWWRDSTSWIWLAGVAVIFAFVALVWPALLAPLNRLWMKFGLLLFRVTNPLILGLLFYGVITPMGWFMRLAGKDPMRRCFEPDSASYWIGRTPPGPAPDSMKNQF